ncbi:lipopolysaccharide export system permease protein [Flavobacterium swingsii]|jgi:lipopolysaccharide export system permease protein|uniref:Lipopolysaccharide export system permease protein n=1 Tax=Flavobacterium swingsii TaxID=498292 RepID=A0A1I0WU39_9FLAO|nr:LptF/LptG family permease [Flavobacterium swingsii]SFA92279.1 lipopolysaccharide export system permease protein [Flavobacterium swingsii]
MKILDKYLLKTYLTSFVSVFVILIFIFILQTVWLFISELAGKDLDIILILKFLLFKMPSLVPLVLPLSILLSAIMTFGDMAENYEFAAMKSAGISFQRTMKGLTVFILLLSVGAFFFANNVIPYAEFKFTNFRKNIAQVKPAMAIAEGQFSTIGNINIKVDKKTGENGEFLEGVTMHKKSDLGEGAKTVIKSKSGQLISSEESNLLQLVLLDGYYYEDITPKNYQDRQKMPFAKVNFKKYNINIDLSKLNKVEGSEENITNSCYMLNLSELRYAVDSLSTSYNKEIVSVADNVYQRVGINTNLQADSISPKKPKTIGLLTFLSKAEKSKILEIAVSDALSSKQNFDINDISLQYRKKDINSFWLSIYEKFVISFACILMFFIGAPLGSIIRKGGLGLPIVFAMLIFITFHFLNTFGKKVAQESGMTPFFGAWISFFILVPLAIFLTRKAINDNGGISFDGITEPIKNIFIKLTQRNKLQ